MCCSTGDCRICTNTERINKVSDDWYQDAIVYRTTRRQVDSVSIPVTDTKVFFVGSRIRNKFGDPGVIVRLYSDNTADIVFGQQDYISHGMGLKNYTLA